MMNGSRTSEAVREHEAVVPLLWERTANCVRRHYYKARIEMFVLVPRDLDGEIPRISK
jgi:hypothetical protein